MFDVGGGELLLIVLVVLLLFGPKKLPEFARTINKGLKKVKQAQAQFQSQINELQNDIETSIDLDDKKTNSSNNFEVKPPPENMNRVGAFDQLNQDDNFVSDYQKPQDSDDINSSENLSDSDEFTEKVSTSKNKKNSS